MFASNRTPIGRFAFPIILFCGAVAVPAASAADPALPAFAGYPETGSATYPAPSLALIPEVTTTIPVSTPIGPTPVIPGLNRSDEPLPAPPTGPSLGTEVPTPTPDTATDIVSPVVTPTPVTMPEPSLEVTPLESGDVTGGSPVVEGLDEEASESEPAAWYQPVYWLGIVPWDTGIEFGLNGSSGTSESLSMRFGGYMRRESDFSKIDLNANYNRTSAGGLETQNNAQFNVRNDWMFSSNSPWSLFGLGTIFYDEFQAFDLQANVSGGVGYRWIDRESLQLTTRAGTGASREFGGPDDSWTPEGQAGIEYEHKIAANQKLIAKVDYFPQLDDLGEYRLVTDVGWEVELIRPSNMSLKISATDRYDSTPNGAEPHNTNYSVLLIWKL